MTNRELLEENGYEDVVVFENPSYEGALIGVTSDRRAIYDIEKMVDSLMAESGMTDDEAIEFIDYNTIRACGYIANSPVVMYNLYYPEIRIKED